MRLQFGASGAKNYAPSAPMAGPSARPLSFTVRGHVPLRLTQE
jgi:phage tail tape-measure protein